MVTWSPGAGGLALSAGNAEPLRTCGASAHLREHLPEVPLLPGPRLPPSFSALLCLISALQIYFPPRLPQAVGLFVVLETSSPEEQEVFGSEEFTAATNSREPAPGVGLCVFPGLQGASSLDGTEVVENPCFRFPAEEASRMINIKLHLEFCDRWPQSPPVTAQEQREQPQIHGAPTAAWSGANQHLWVDGGSGPVCPPVAV